MGATVSERRVKRNGKYSWLSPHSIQAGAKESCSLRVSMNRDSWDWVIVSNMISSLRSEKLNNGREYRLPVSRHTRNTVPVFSFNIIYRISPKNKSVRIVFVFQTSLPIKKYKYPLSRLAPFGDDYP